MKRLLIVFLFCSWLASAAITATAQWDVRTAGSDTNGGCFDPVSGTPGTNYSALDSPQVAFTDLVIAATTTNVTSAGNPFSSLSVGNCINVTGGTGFTAGRYQVMSVSASIATLDRSVGTAASTGGTGNLGGGLQVIATALAAITSGNVINIKNGTYTITSALAMSGITVSFVGYNTSHQDGGTRPTITTSTNSVNGFNISNLSTYVTIDNLILTSTAGTPGDAIHALSSNGVPMLVLSNSKLSGWNTGVNGNFAVDYNFNTCRVTNTEISNSTNGITNAYACRVDFSYIHDMVTDGITNAAGGPTGSDPIMQIAFTVIANCGRYGINQTNNTFTWEIYNSSIVNNTSDGIHMTANVGSLRLYQNIIYGNGGFGVNLPSSFTALQVNRFNAYGSNTGGNRQNFYVGGGDFTLTVNPFTNSAGGDYSLNNTAGGGASLRGAATASVFTGNALTDIGAVQRLITGGGGGGQVAYPTVQ